MSLKTSRAAELERRFGQLVAAAREAWPGIELADEAFLAYLTERVPADVSLREGLRTIHAPDLYVACACAQGDARAIAAFEKRYFPELDAHLARMKLGEADVDEVKQVLREVLFTRARGTPPAILEFAGRGDLRAWLRVTAVREALRRLRKARRDGQPDALLELVAPDDDPELAYLKARYRAELKKALAAAIEALPARDRNLLRQHHVDGLGVERLGALYKVHHATAARWVARARDELMAATRKALLARLGVDRAELESILRLIRSRLDLSLARLLKKTR